jgi:hypothetical protein
MCKITRKINLVPIVCHMFVMIIELCATDQKLILADLDCQEFETKKITLFVMQSSIFSKYIPQHNFSVLPNSQS